MKKTLAIIFTLALLAACNNKILLPNNGSSDGMGNVLIKLGGSTRTLLPVKYDAAKMSFVLTFTPSEDGDPIIEILNQKTDITLQLYAGDWSLDVKGYLSGDDMLNPATAKVTGSEDFNVSPASSNVTVLVDLFPNNENLTQSESGTGTLSYDITFPAGTTGSLALYDYPDGNTLVESVNFTSAGFIRGDLQLKSGFYHVYIIARFGGKEKTWRELAHIYDGTITVAAHGFVSGDFVNSDTAAIVNVGFSLPDEYLNINDITGIITVYVPGETNITVLNPFIGFTGAMIVPAPKGPANFTAPVTYTVYTESGASKTYSVTVIKSVSDIIGIPEAAAVGDLVSLAAEVIPNDTAKKTIDWSITNAGTTGAAYNGNNLVAASAGTAVLTATIVDGVAIGTPFVKTFSITFIVPVKDFTGVPDTAFLGVPLTLEGTVVPSGATNKSVEWNIESIGDTGATITGNTLNVTGVGTVTVSATINNAIISNGSLAAYTDTFVIDVLDLPSIYLTIADLNVTDEASGVFDEIGPIILNQTVGTSQTINADGFDNVEWIFGGNVLETGNSIILEASGFNVGEHTLYMAFTIDDTPWLASLDFKVIE